MKHNHVAKHMWKFNHKKVETDRKKQAKKGYSKHKKSFK